MFTGIIEDQGLIKKITRQAHAARLIIQSQLPAQEISCGDSISIDGVCLTVTDIKDHNFIVDISPETLQRTTLGLKREQDSVNLERALRFSDRLGGHLVTGHIDGVATIASAAHAGNALQINFSAPAPILRYLVDKGSVAIDGISLTVNQCSETSFTVMIIPFTASHTTLSRKKAGDLVNIETDVIGKYVEKFLLKKEAGYGPVTREFLDKFNFT